MADDDASPLPNGLRILVVDHNSTDLSSLQQLIKDCGHSATACDSLEPALELLRNSDHGFDAVLCDASIPGLDGIPSFLDEIARDMNLSVILMMAEDGRTFIGDTIHHLTKPVNKEQIESVWALVYEKKLEWKSPDDQTGNVHNRREHNDDTNLTSPVTKKRRVSWTLELHSMFVEAVNHYGIDKVTPKKILKYMNVEGLTRDHVSSHLQKYRQQLKTKAEAKAKSEAVQVYHEPMWTNQNAINQNPNIVQQYNGEGNFPMQTMAEATLTSLNQQPIQVSSRYTPSMVGYSSHNIHTQLQNYSQNNNMISSNPLASNGGSNYVLDNSFRTSQNAIKPTLSQLSGGSNYIWEYNPLPNRRMIGLSPFIGNRGGNYCSMHNPLTNCNTIDQAGLYIRESRSFTMRNFTNLPNGNDTRNLQANQGLINNSHFVNEMNTFSNLPSGNNMANQGLVNNSPLVDGIKNMNFLPNRNNTIDLKDNEEFLDYSLLDDYFKPDSNDGCL